MKSSDADLIKKLNALPERDRADLLEFLAGRDAAGMARKNLLEMLNTSFDLQKKSGAGPRH